MPTRPTLGTRVADWIGLAAAPAFAVLALWCLGNGAEMLCAPEAMPLGGMAMIYLLMSAFHLAPWLKRFSRRESYP